MSLSKKELINLSSTSVYFRGEEYFQQNRVNIIEYDDEFVEAEVRGSIREPYQVSIEFTDDGNGLFFCDCDCQKYEGYYGICKHIVATVLKVQSLPASKFAAVQQKKSDTAVTSMLNNYVESIIDKAAEAQAGRVRFEPVFEYNASLSLFLFFRVGEQRMYIVPALEAFKDRFRERATANYGKNYTLRHGLASFCADSRPLVEFVLKYYNTNNYIYNPSYSYGFYNFYRDRRNMFLSPFMADELFTILEGKKITVRDNNKKETFAHVKREDFHPRLRLKEEDGGATLDIKDRFTMLPGHKRVYVFSGDTVYCCNEEFTQACGVLLESLRTSNNSLFIAKEDMDLLFSAVLPGIVPYTNLIYEGDFEQHKPLPLITKVYLDSPEDDSVTARMTFTYGNKTIDAFGDKKLTISKDIAGEVFAERLLVRYFTNAELIEGTLLINNDSNAVFRFITEGLDELLRIAEIYATNAFSRFKIRPPVVVTMGIKTDAGLMHLNFNLEGVDLSELPAILASYRQTKKYHRLRDGSFLVLEKNALEGLSELAEGFDLSEKQLISGHAETTSSRALYLDLICKRNEEMRVDRDQGFKKILRDMHEVENADFPVPEGLHNILRNYQKTGYRWLKTIAAYGFGGILADDMGLGKTLQILTMFKSYYEGSGEKLPSIVICPASLSFNWESESQKFTPELRIVVISGSATDRTDLISQSSTFDLLITSYDLLKRDIELYEPLRFEYVIIDEAQYIKNQNTQNAKSVKALNGKIRFALTGTPVENSLAELWSIFDFLMPGYLLAYNRFLKKYEVPIVKRGEKDASERLKQLIKPFLLRRLKKDVLKELPPKTESILLYSMESEQKKVYIANLAQAKKELLDKTGIGAGQDRIKILAALTRIRQICCDPALIYENYSSGSTKLLACIELIERCIQSEHRLLLFSQFTSMLDIIEKELDNQGVEYFRIDGSTKPSRRLELVNTFNNGTVPVFLISLKAGGTGLNLTGADIVIHYDPWWNLSVQNQATDRAHRIGQRNSVHVYKLIVKDTIEERILVMQEKKADLANAIIEENSNPFEKLSREELLSLLDG